MRRFVCCLALLCLGSLACADEPQAEFSVKAGWVEFTVRADGKPVADAAVTVLGAGGRTFAEGTTGAEGQGEFPMPPGAWFNVEIKVGKRTADPIRLQRVGKTVEPAQVLLSYGLRPCCRFLERGEAVKNAILPGPIKRDLAKEARADLEERKFRPLSQPLQALLADTKYRPIPTQTHTLLLDTAPDFTLPAVQGAKWSLAEHLKQGSVVLVFYYGYHCNHCVSQLFGLDKDLEKFRELGVHVVAVSADKPELTRERFEKYGAFKFPVLSDPANKVAEQYGAYHANPKKGDDGDLLHATFVIGRDGVVVWANRGDGPFTENRTLLHRIAQMERR